MSCEATLGLWRRCLYGNLCVMELAELVKMEGGQAAFAKRIGCSKSYLNHVLKGRKTFGPALAIRVFKATGKKLGPMAKSAA